MTGFLNALMLGAGLSIVSAGIAYLICRFIERRSGTTSTSIWHAARLAAVLPVLFSPIIYLFPEAASAAGGSDAGFDLGNAVTMAVPVGTPVSGWNLFAQSLQLDLVALLLYGGGLALVALAALRRRAWMSNLMRETRTASGDERTIFERLVRRLDVRPPEFRVTPRSTSPFLTGWVPSIVAPETLFDDPAATRFALAHELTHLRRGDERDRIIGSALGSVLWFNLPLRWIEKSLNEAREIACDAESLEALGGAERKPYAAALISMMRSSAQTVSAFGPDDRRHREMRIKSILAGPTRSRPSKTLLLLTIAAAVIPVACAQTALTERAVMAQVMVHAEDGQNHIHQHGDGDVALNDTDHRFNMVFVTEDGETIEDGETVWVMEGDTDEHNNVFFSDQVGEADEDGNYTMVFVTADGHGIEREDTVWVNESDSDANVNVYFNSRTGEADEHGNFTFDSESEIRFVGVDGDAVQVTRIEVTEQMEWTSEDGNTIIRRILDEDGEAVAEFRVRVESVSEPHLVEELPRVGPVREAPAAPDGEKSNVAQPARAPQFSVKPAEGRISSLYGPRPDRPAGSPAFHYGADIAAPHGTAIQATGSGIVTHAQMGLNNNDAWGNTVVIDHGNGWQTVYAHMQGFDIELGDIVSAGDQIGRIGTTGRTTGPHVHVELRHNGERIDPAGHVPGL